MNRIIKPIIILGILIGVAVYFFVTNKNSTLSQKARNFNIRDTGAITRIELNKSADTIILTKKENNWFLNDELKAKKREVQTLLNIVKEIEPGAPVSKEYKKELLSKMDTHGIHARFFKNDKLKKSLSIYLDTTGSEDRTFMKREDYKQPFEVRLPGFQIEIAHFFITKKSFWLNNVLYNYSYDDIQEITIKTPGKKRRNFTIKKGNQKNFLLFFEDTLYHDINQFRAQAYFFKFKILHFNKYADITKEEKSKILSRPPQSIISIKEADETSEVVKIYPITYKDDAPGNFVKHDPYRVYAHKKSSPHLVILNYIKIDPLVKEVDYFFKKDS